LLDCLSQGKKLSHANAAFRPGHAGELVQCGIADLALHDVFIVQHRKLECQTLLIVSLDFVTSQWHRRYSPDQMSISTLERLLRPINFRRDRARKPHGDRTGGQGMV
jgi:hypothetical protein